MKTFVFLSFCCFFQPVFCQNWEQVSSVPALGRDDGVGFSLNGFGFVVTGNQNGFVESNKLFKFNPQDNTWESSTPFPGEARQYAGAFVLDGLAYVFCGLSAANEVLNDVWQFNPKSSEWKRLSDFPGEGRWSFFTFATTDFGFLGAGSTWLYGLVSDCWKYNPKKDEWITIQDYPEGPVRDGAAFCLGNDCFAGTGFKVAPLQFSKKFFKYDVFNDQWTRIQDFPGEARGYMGAESSGDKAIVGGGWGDQNTYFQDNYLYTLQNGWEKMSGFANQGWRGMSSFCIARVVYFLTGLYENLSRTSDVFCYSFSNQPKAILYPNPTINQSVLYNSFGGKVEIYNANGCLMEEMPPSEKGYHTLPALSAGQYLVKISTETTEFILKWLIL